jgi:hypothetical protein
MATMLPKGKHDEVVYGPAVKQFLKDTVIICIISKLMNIKSLVLTREIFVSSVPQHFSEFTVTSVLAMGRKHVSA